MEIKRNSEAVCGYPIHAEDLTPGHVYGRSDYAAMEPEDNVWIATDEDTVVCLETGTQMGASEEGVTYRALRGHFVLEG